MIDAAHEFVAERLNADLAGTGLPDVEFTVDADWTSEVVLVCGGHEFPLDVVGAVEYACAFAADRLQDDAMDELNRPWPELINTDGESIGVLAAEVDGVAVWKLKGEPFCAVGQLHRATAAAGLRIK